MNQQSLNRAILNLVLLWALLAGYFAFTDLQISISLFDSFSGWAKFLEKFGEIPGLLVLYSGTFISLLHYLSGSNKFKFLLLPILLLVATFLSSYFVIVMYGRVTSNGSTVLEYKYYIGSILLLLNLFAAYQLRNVKLEDRVLEYANKSVLLGFVGYLLFIQPLKLIWGRVRFRCLDLLYTNFTPWFLPNGITGQQSFPSGHAAMAWMILPLLILLSNKSKTLRGALLLIIIFWGTVVPISRIVVGAHYPSDVLFGACIIILSYLMLYTKDQ